MLNDIHHSESRWRNSQKGGLVRGYDKPIHGSCAIYFRAGIPKRSMARLGWKYPRVSCHSLASFPCPEASTWWILNLTNKGSFWKSIQGCFSPPQKRRCPILLYPTCLEVSSFQVHLSTWLYFFLIQLAKVGASLLRYFFHLVPTIELIPRF